MEHLENEIIRQKVNSLDSLSEEQSAALDSKFELLMTGISGKKKSSKKRILIPLGLVGILLLLLWINSNRIGIKNPSDLFKSEKIVKNKSDKDVNKKIIDRSNKNSTTSLPAGTNKYSVQVDMNQSLIQLTALNNEQQDSLIVNKRLVLTDSTNIVVKTENDIPVLTDSSMTINSTSIKQKPKRHRFTEIDFESDGHATNNMANQSSKSAPSFSIKFNLKGNIVQSGQPATPFRLQKEF